MLVNTNNTNNTQILYFDDFVEGNIISFYFE